MESDIHQLVTLFPDISIQLRSAMSNLHLAAALLAPAERRETDPVLDKQAALLDQSYYRLQRLVNNLTALADLDQEDPPPERDQDIVETVAAVFESTVSLAELMGIHLSFVCAMDHCICAFRKEDLEQILFQLLSNALKFTPRGGSVTVELKRSGSLLLLSVADTGCGIPQDRLDTLFDQFLRQDRMAPYPHGMGLGLSICRRLAARMGGSLLARSRDGQGSCFTLSLPDRQCGRVSLSDVPFDYTGGFNRTLLALADALPAEAFRYRSQT